MILSGRRTVSALLTKCSLRELNLCVKLIVYGGFEPGQTCNVGKKKNDFCTRNSNAAFECSSS